MTCLEGPSVHTENLCVCLGRAAVRRLRVQFSVQTINVTGNPGRSEAKALIPLVPLIHCIHENTTANFTKPSPTSPTKPSAHSPQNQHQIFSLMLHKYFNHIRSTESTPQLPIASLDQNPSFPSTLVARATQRAVFTLRAFRVCSACARNSSWMRMRRISSTRTTAKTRTPTPQALRMNELFGLNHF